MRTVFAYALALNVAALPIDAIGQESETVKFSPSTNYRMLNLKNYLITTNCGAASYQVKTLQILIKNVNPHKFRRVVKLFPAVAGTPAPTPISAMPIKPNPGLPKLPGTTNISMLDVDLSPYINSTSQLLRIEVVVADPNIRFYTENGTPGMALTAGDQNGRDIFCINTATPVDPTPIGNRQSAWFYVKYSNPYKIGSFNIALVVGDDDDDDYNMILLVDPHVRNNG